MATQADVAIVEPSNPASSLSPAPQTNEHSTYNAPSHASPNMEPTTTASISQDDATVTSASSSPVQPSMSSQSEDSALLHAFRERSVPIPTTPSNPPSRPSTARLSLRAISHIYSAVRGNSTTAATTSQDAAPPTWQGPFEQLPSNSSTDASARPTPRDSARGGDVHGDGVHAAVHDAAGGIHDPSIHDPLHIEAAATVYADVGDTKGHAVQDAASGTLSIDTPAPPVESTTNENNDQGACAPMLQGTYMGFPILFIGNTSSSTQPSSLPLQHTPMHTHPHPKTHPKTHPHTNSTEMNTPRTRLARQRSSHFDVQAALQSPPTSVVHTPRGQHPPAAGGPHLSALAAHVRARLHRLLAEALLVTSLADVYSSPSIVHGHHAVADGGAGGDGAGGVGGGGDTIDIQQTQQGGGEASPAVHAAVHTGVRDRKWRVKHTSLEQLLEDTVAAVVALCAGHQRAQQQGAAALSIMRTQCDTLQQQLAQLQKTYDDAQAAARRDREQLTVLQAQHSGLLHRYKASKASHGQQHQEHVVELAVAQEHAHTLQQQNARLVKQLAAAHKEAVGAKEATAAAAKRVRQATHEASIQIQALQQRVHTLQQQQQPPQQPPPHTTPSPLPPSPTPFSHPRTPAATPPNTRPLLNTTTAFATLCAAYAQQHTRTGGRQGDARLRAVLSSRSATTRDPSMVGKHVRRLCRMAAAHGVTLELVHCGGGCWRLGKAGPTLVLQVADARLLARTGGGWEGVLEVVGRMVRV